MLYLSTTQSNVLTVTLYEASSNVVNPYFTWKIKNVDSDKVTLFYQEDHSNAPYYYNSFTISVATFSGLTAGILKLGTDIVVGQYQYQVYEMANPFDLDINNAISIVENGILEVTGNSSNIVTNTDDDLDEIYTNTDGD